MALRKAVDKKNFGSIGIAPFLRRIITPSGVWTVNGLNFGGLRLSHRSFDDGCPSDSGSAVNSAGASYHCAQGIFATSANFSEGCSGCIDLEENHRGSA